MTPAFAPVPSLYPSEPGGTGLPLVSVLAAWALLAAGCAQSPAPEYPTAEQPSEASSDTEDDTTDDTTDDNTNGDEEPVEDPEDDPEDDNLPDEQPVLSPTEGDWVITEATRTKDGCGLDQFTERGEAGSVLSLDGTGEASFDLVFNGGSETVNCTVDEDQRYLCSAETSEDYTPAEYGLNAVILVDLVTHGEFFSNSEMSLISVVDLNCTGPQCGLVGFFLGTTFPCRMVTDSMSVSN